MAAGCDDGLIKASSDQGHCPALRCTFGYSHACAATIHVSIITQSGLRTSSFEGYCTALKVTRTIMNSSYCVRYVYLCAIFSS